MTCKNNTIRLNREERERERERQMNSTRKMTTKRKDLTGTQIREDRKVPSSSVICFHVGF